MSERTLLQIAAKNLCDTLAQADQDAIFLAYAEGGESVARDARAEIERAFVLALSLCHEDDRDADVRPVPPADTARLDKLNRGSLFHAIRNHRGKWHLTYAPDTQYEDVRGVIDAAREMP